jgi:ribosome-binding protein aMBF1 (putative translation factor)
MYEPSKCRVCGSEIPGRHPSVPKLTHCKSCAGLMPTPEHAPASARADGKPALPAGILTAEQTEAALDAHERLPHPRSYREQEQRSKQLDSIVASLAYHQRKESA